MKIINLKIQNYLRIKAVDITPGEGVVYLTGKNGAGKSSVLKAIWAAFENKALTKEVISPIREGEEGSVIRVDLGELVVTRTFTRDGSYLKVEGPTGQISSPQTLLNKLKSSLTFDPMQFCRMEPKAQRETLIKLVGVDTDKIDVNRAGLFAERTIENRREKELRAQIEGFRIPAGTPDQPINSAVILQDIRYCEKMNARIHALKTGIETTELEIEALKQKIFEKTEHNNRLKTELGTLCFADTTDLETELTNAEQINQAVEQKKQLNRLKLAEEVTKQRSDFLTDSIDALDREKKKMLKEAKFPVEGLSFNSDGVLWKGIPLSQASSSEQIRVSLAMGMAMAPDLRIMMIQDGSLLDMESRKIVEHEAEEHDMQVWCEVVDEAGENMILIEDGEVKE